MKLKFLLIIVFAFIQILNTNLFAQISNVDSCIQVLKNAKEDTNKVILLDKIAWDISYGNLQKGIDYSKQSYELAKKIIPKVLYIQIWVS
jgi:hypothetical protein